MINLLPPAAKKGILIEYWVRVISVWLILWSLALLAAASLSFPAYVFTATQIKLHQDSATQAMKQVTDYEQTSVALTRASQQARIIVDGQQVDRFSKYVFLLEQLQGTDVQVSTIALERVEDGMAPITVGGTARDRQALASFRDRLLTNEAVVSVDLPISNLAKDKDIQFTISVTLRKSDQV